MPLPTYEVPQAVEHARTRLAYGRDPSNRRNPADPMQSQIERQVARLGADDSFGMTSLEGFGWTEEYKFPDGENKGKKMGETSYEVVSDVISEHPDYDTKKFDPGLLDPKLVMMNGHKVLWPNLRLKDEPKLKSMLTLIRYTYIKVPKGETHDRAVATEPAYTDDGEIDPNFEIVKIMHDKEIRERSAVFHELDGHFSAQNTSLWYKKPEEEEPKPEVVPFDFEYKKGKPVMPLYSQLASIREHFGFDEQSSAFVWEQGDVLYRATSTLLHSKPTLAGGNARRVVTIERFEGGRLMGETILDDTSKKGKPSVEEYINSLATSPVRPTNTRLEIIETPDLIARRERADRRTRAAEVRLGAMATPAETTTGIRDKITETEAILMLAKITERDRTSDHLMAIKLRETRSKNFFNIKTLQKISTEIGKNGIFDQAGEIVDQYAKVLGLLRMKVTPEHENDLSWAIRAIAFERRREDEEELKRAADPAYRTRVESGMTAPADPTKSRIKRKEIADFKIGQEFFDYIAPEMKSWGKQINESTREEELVLNLVRKVTDHLMIRLDDSMTKRLSDSINLIVAKKDSKGDRRIPYDADLVNVGRILSRSVGE